MAEKTAETWAEAARQDKGQNTRPPPAAPDTWAEAAEKDKKSRQKEEK